MTEDIKSKRKGKREKKDGGSMSFKSLILGSQSRLPESSTGAVSKKRLITGRKSNRRSSSSREVSDLTLPLRDTSPIVVVEAKSSHLPTSFIEIGFAAGDIVQVLRKLICGWWFGQVFNRVGFFPSTKLQLEQDQLSPERFSGITISVEYNPMNEVIQDYFSKWSRYQWDKTSLNARVISYSLCSVFLVSYFYLYSVKYVVEWWMIC